MSASDILKMIEEVDPSDTAKLDEIDARVWCFVNSRDPEGDCWIAGERKNQWQAAYLYHDSKEYTRSRDALKAIRPKGFVSGAFPNTKHGTEIGIEFHGYCQSDDRAFETLIDFDPLPTEELAELHAIIQAIEYEETK